MAGNWVICIYKPHEGKEVELQSLFRRHYSTLRSQGLVTERRPFILRSRSDGAYLEFFEWKSDSAASEAHNNERVLEIWKGFSQCAEMLKLKDLVEANEMFPHFEDATVLAQ